MLQGEIALQRLDTTDTIGGMELADSLHILKFQAMCQLGSSDLVDKVRDLASTLVANASSGSDIRNAYVLELVGALAVRYKPKDYQQGSLQPLSFIRVSIPNDYPLIQSYHLL